MATKRVVAKKLEAGALVMAHVGDKSVAPFVARAVTRDPEGVFVRVETDSVPRTFWCEDVLLVAEA
jgi:hypothetical protein